MYSITSQILKVKKSKTGEVTNFNPGNEKYKPSNEFDLPNQVDTLSEFLTEY